MIVKLIFIGVGGFAGAIARYLLSELTMKMVAGNFPYGTLLVNLVGSFFLGLLLALGLRMETISANMKALGGLGFLGAFTTFSTFSVDILLLLEQGLVLRALVYISISVLGGMGAAALGYLLGKA